MTALVMLPAVLLYRPRERTLRGEGVTGKRSENVRMSRTCQHPWDPNTCQFGLRMIRLLAS